MLSFSSKKKNTAYVEIHFIDNIYNKKYVKATFSHTPVYLFVAICCTGCILNDPIQI